MNGLLATLPRWYTAGPAIGIIVIAPLDPAGTGLRLNQQPTSPTRKDNQ